MLYCYLYYLVKFPATTKCHHVLKEMRFEVPKIEKKNLPRRKEKWVHMSERMKKWEWNLTITTQIKIQNKCIMKVKTLKIVLKLNYIIYICEIYLFLVLITFILDFKFKYMFLKH